MIVGKRVLHRSGGGFLHTCSNKMFEGRWGNILSLKFCKQILDIHFRFFWIETKKKPEVSKSDP